MGQVRTNHVVISSKQNRADAPEGKVALLAARFMIASSFDEEVHPNRTYIGGRAEFTLRDRIRETDALPYYGVSDCITCVSKMHLTAKRATTSYNEQKAVYVTFGKSSSPARGIAATESELNVSS